VGAIPLRTPLLIPNIVLAEQRPWARLPQILTSARTSSATCPCSREILAAVGHPQTRFIVAGGSDLALQRSRAPTRELHTITALDQRAQCTVALPEASTSVRLPDRDAGSEGFLRLQGLSVPSAILRSADTDRRSQP
jgi:hypothetical protein